MLKLNAKVMHHLTVIKSHTQSCGVNSFTKWCCLLQVNSDKTREYFERLIFHVFNADIIQKFYLEPSKLISSTCSIIFDDMLT